MRATSGKKKRKSPKEHICKDCGKPLWSTPGHSQFRGIRYCPSAHGQVPKQQWLEQKRRERGLRTGNEGVSRTTLWRQTKSSRRKKRKEYSCRVCGEVMSLKTGHTQYYGERYCPKQHRNKEEWLRKKRAEKGAQIKKKKPEVKKLVVEEQEGTEREKKMYTCTTCNQPLKDTSHTHYRGIRYCPYEDGQISFEKWITQRHTEYEAFIS